MCFVVCPHLPPIQKSWLRLFDQGRRSRNRYMLRANSIFGSGSATYWNDRRSRRVRFLCFYSAIFKLTSAKFQTFADNLRAV